MFVQVTNGTVTKYPYTVGDLRRDNPNTSFPKHVPESLMANYGMYPVGYQAAPDYNPLTHRLQHSDVPSLVDGEWKLTKTVVALTDQQIANNTASKTKEVREKRDQLLADTDWTVLQDSPFTDTQTADWVIYRQALRDITDHANFPYLTEDDWPTKP